MEAAVKAYQSVTQKEFRDRLVMEHLESVRHVLGRMIPGLPRFIDADNLESAGVLGLVEAAAQFDPTRGVEFKTFAYHRIRGAILDELRRNCPLPQQVLQQWARLRQVWEQLGELASPATVAAACGLTEEEVEDCLTAIRITQPEVWQAELSHHQRASDADAEPIERLNADDERRLLADAIERLPNRLRVVLSLYYMEDLRLAEIGAVLNLSESRVSRLLAQAQLQLKHSLERTRSGDQTRRQHAAEPLRGPTVLGAKKTRSERTPTE
ncbi:sigma-70 family RNA polymerase sigma factor [Planctomicrobium piriforme]|uniref:RNA polymerase sigma factor for flagellar operon FliA n=1 Tax=Planctomicrobium piriforme TaxID=1576369 RepID=A0A1I3HMM7_9PLAN|nr:sigma-70 family RNA polymerase sigma factor [Planctomicrobium piriforme]SFI36837.1 RNA polymerase sigma factor for flagellar operon FliA [Planctomicrobium piriforme]